MAEKPQLRIADQDHVSDNDPFAELTRIMGFDPRVPVRQEPELDAPQSASTQDFGHDFGIDLEKELMGEFAADEPGDDTRADAFEVADDPSGDYAPQAQPFEARSVSYEPEPEGNFEPMEFEPEISGDAAAPADTFETDFASSMESELSLDGDWVAAEHDSVDAAPEYVQEHRSVPEAAPEFASYQESEFSHDDFSEDFDAALAEVDMDFTAVPLGSSGNAEADLDRELQLQLAQEPIEPAAVAAAPQPSPEPQLSLEDELNALLGTMAPRAVHDVAAVEMEEAEHSFADDAGAPYDQGEYEAAPVAEEFAPAVEAVTEEPVFDDFVPEPEPVAEEPLADDLMLASEMPTEQSYAYARSNYRTGDQAYPAPVSDFAALPDAAPVEAYAAQDAGELAAEDDFGFDDDAFDDAFANSIEDEQPEYESRPVAEEQAEPAPSAADPYADLASLTAQFVPSGPVGSWREQARQPDQYAVQYEQADDAPAAEAPAGAFGDFPDIETVEVPEQAVALSDDLDIPEIVYEEEPASSPAYDDIDAEFASLLNDMNSPEPAAAASVGNEEASAQPQAEAHAGYAADFAYPAAAFAAAAGMAAGSMGAAAHGQNQTAMAFRQEDFAGQDFAVQSGQSGYGQQPFPDELDYDPEFDEEMAPPVVADRRQPQRRGMLIAAIVGGVALIGGIGAFALAGGGSDSQAPALVKADDSPIKVRPENPGGAKVPNQDNQVYDAVSRTAGATAPQPQQETLVTSAEEPVEMAAQDDEPALDETELAQGAEAPAPTAKSEDRIEQILDEGAGSETGVPVVTPRKVRTMVVKADGTLVPREDPAPQVAAAQETNPTASESMIEPNTTGLSNESTAAVPPAEARANAEPVPAEAGAAPRAAAQSSTTPNSVAVAPTRPSDQPVDVVGEVKADQVAALAPAAAGGGWSMQIASQPSEAAAQSSYQDLLRRYGSVLNGHQANVVKAEIAGKGTFWRVRVPAETREAAIKLCESYKAAGGSCFVSK